VTSLMKLVLHLAVKFVLQLGEIRSPIVGEIRSPIIGEIRSPIVGNDDERKMDVLPPIDLAGGSDETPRLAQAGPAFSSPSGDSIAHFIYESYFGRKSLAQRYREQSALLGCSKIADYLTLRNGGSSVVFSPHMFNNLLAAVIKKFSNEVIPQFIDSPMFQVMVYCLIQTDYFTESSEKGKEQRRALDEEIIASNSSVLIDSVWPACYVIKKQKVEDDASSSDESDSGSE